jgi:hypothetical protein
MDCVGPEERMPPDSINVIYIETLSMIRKQMERLKASGNLENRHEKREDPF